MVHVIIGDYLRACVYQNMEINSVGQAVYSPYHFLYRTVTQHEIEFYDPPIWLLVFSSLGLGRRYFQSKKGRVNRVGAILDHVTQFRPEADFVKLCDALSATQQQHVVHQYLTRDAFQQAAADISTEEVNRAAVSLQGSIVDNWRTVLVENRTPIIDMLDSSDDFINRLVKYGVMNFATGELCRVSCHLYKSYLLTYMLAYLLRNCTPDFGFARCACPHATEICDHDCERIRRRATLRVV